MIISHQYRYLFIEIPLTGSWAIRNELCDNYDGEPILHKHATYPEFQRFAQEEEKNYFVFGTVRNPLDEVVSRYYKLKTDHKGVFSDTNHVRSLESDYADLKKYDFIHTSNASFVDYFRKYHKRPFGGLIDIASSRYDYVIRYENLQDDFLNALAKLKIDNVGPVPVTNKTQGKKVSWKEHYTPEIIQQACRIFGPFMRKWNYEFPSEWGDYHIRWIDQIGFDTVNTVRNVYSNYFRYNDQAYARLIRSLRAHLVN